MMLLMHSDTSWLLEFCWMVLKYLELAWATARCTICGKTAPHSCNAINPFKHIQKRTQKAEKEVSQTPNCPHPFAVSEGGENIQQCFFFFLLFFSICLDILLECLLALWMRFKLVRLKKTFTFRTFYIWSGLGKLRKHERELESPAWPWKFCKNLV